MWWFLSLCWFAVAFGIVWTTRWPLTSSVKTEVRTPTLALAFSPPGTRGPAAHHASPNGALREGYEEQEAWSTQPRSPTAAAHLRQKTAPASNHASKPRQPADHSLLSCAALSLLHCKLKQRVMAQARRVAPPVLCTPAGPSRARRHEPGPHARRSRPPRRRPR